MRGQLTHPPVYAVRTDFCNGSADKYGILYKECICLSRPNSDNRRAYITIAKTLQVIVLIFLVGKRLATTIKLKMRSRLYL